MIRRYIKGKGVLVGTFTEDDMLKEIDIRAIEKVKAETGYEYVNSECIMKGDIIIGIKHYVCRLEDYNKFPLI